MKRIDAEGVRVQRVPPRRGERAAVVVKVSGLTEQPVVVKVFRPRRR